MKTKISDLSLVEQVHECGVSVTDLDRLEMERTEEFLEAASWSLAHLKQAPAVPDAPDNPASAFSHCTIHDPREIARARPELFLWFLSDRWLDMMTGIVGDSVVCKGINFRKDLPMDRQTGTRVWHRDAEDARVGKIILYLDDVDNDNGPFEYIPRQQSAEFSAGTQTWTDAEMERMIDRDHWRSCPGQAGTIIIGDTASVLHHGCMPVGNRFVAIATYTSANPVNRHLVKGSAFATAVPLFAHRMTPRQRHAILDFEELVQPVDCH